MGNCLSVCVSQAADLPFLITLLGRRLVEVLPQVSDPFQNYAMRLVKEMMADGVTDLVGRAVVSGWEGAHGRGGWLGGGTWPWWVLVWHAGGIATCSQKCE